MVFTYYFYSAAYLVAYPVDVKIKYVSNNYLIKTRHYIAAEIKHGNKNSFRNFICGRYDIKNCV